MTQNTDRIIFKAIEDGVINEITCFPIDNIDKLRGFHNWIKSKLIENAKNYTLNNKINIDISDKNFNEPTKFKSGLKLLDVAVGRAGDLHKWSRFGVKFVTGIDSDKNSIYGEDGAIKRVNSVKHIKSCPKCCFWNISAIDPKVLEKINGKDRGMLYDIVSCQFAFHYFVKEIDTVLDMISKKLNPGGFFIGTASNGDLIKRNLESGDIDTGSLKIKKINDESYSYELTCNSSERRTYFEIREEVIPEYFLSPDFLVEKCKEYNLEPVSVQTFHEWKEYYYKTVTDVIKLSDMSAQESIASFLNFSFSFVKI